MSGQHHQHADPLAPDEVAPHRHEGQRQRDQRRDERHHHAEHERVDDRPRSSGSANVEPEEIERPASFAGDRAFEDVEDGPREEHREERRQRDERTDHEHPAARGHDDGPPASGSPRHSGETAPTLQRNYPWHPAVSNVLSPGRGTWWSPRASRRDRGQPEPRSLPASWLLRACSPSGCDRPAQGNALGTGSVTAQPFIVFFRAA